MSVGRRRRDGDAGGRRGSGVKALLDAIQDDLPLTSRPFAVLGERCAMSEEAVISGLLGYRETGLLREISAILDGRRLGFRSSLLAVRVPEERIEVVAARVSAHLGVSHNYQREHEYNLWFTLAVPARDDFFASVQSLLGRGFEAADVIDLPALKTYKLRVRLSVGSSRGGRADSAARPSGVRPAVLFRGRRSDSAPHAVELSESETRLLSVLERPFPIVGELWEEIARRSGLDEATVVASITRWKELGVIRRIAGVLRHRRLGYTANGMSCYAVPEGRIDDAGKRAAEHEFVSHCYHRNGDGKWPYPLFAMIHARDRDECLRRAGTIAAEVGADAHEVLFSVREFKKERVRYFAGVKQ